MRTNALTLARSIAAPIALLGLLGGCDLRAARRNAAMEQDPIPPLYQGPLTVEANSGSTPMVTYSQSGKRRIDRSYSSGAAHMLLDVDQGVIYRWAEFERDKGVLHVGPMSAGAKANGLRWEGRKEAQRLGRCSAAGETGFVYRHTRDADLKGPEYYQEACITTDGVVLSQGVGSMTVGSSGRPSPATPSYLATAVRRGPLPAGVFAVPQGLIRADDP
ncbi:hypothetical protein [uncultured Phenylobacterium sp.]|uniref:hypothetical protein n=1 Tax=uncultured Phenylobacterium sp. TaxID=349273 RepID=UPI0025D5701F|nr:hypothetical protein [uncultured Phenylobacterium sp.]